MTLLVQSRDGARTRTGEVTDYKSLTLTLRYNRTSSWLLELDARSTAVDLLTLTGGIIVTRDGTVLLSGPVDTITRTRDGDTATVTVTGFDDTVWLENRLALPVPTGPPYTTAEHDVRTGVAETVLRAYVNANAGPSAPVARRVDGLTLAADQARGSTVTESARFTPLLEVAQRVALAGGELGFRVVQTATTAVEFQVYEPADRTGTAVFSVDRGNLTGYSYSLSRPRATHVIVAGQGEGTARTFHEAGDASAITEHGRLEVFRDRRDTNDPTLLAQAAAETLAEEGAQSSLSLTPVDTPAVAYGVDWTLGDRVRVIVDGTTIEDLVREVTLTYGPDGETLRPVVGTPGGDAGQAVRRLFSRLRAVDRRTSTLEKG